MKLYMIRHGESEYNLSGRWTGWHDVSLTDKGVEDAKKAGALLDGVVFDKIYSSDLKRAVSTAKIVIPGCEPEITPLLREMNVGELGGTELRLTTDEQRKYIAENGYDMFNGEGKAEFRNRVSEFLKLAESLECNNVAAFSHAGLIRTVLDLTVGMYLPRDRVRCNNCNIAVFEFSDMKWRLYSWINI